MSSVPIAHGLGSVCPYCRAPFAPDEEITACPACGTPHHADCFAENGGCTVFGCTAGPGEEPKVEVTPTDFYPPPASGPAARLGGSIYNLRTASTLEPVPIGPPPPPPMPAGAAPPPPQFAGTLPGYAMAYPAALSLQPFPGYGYGAYVKPKSRVAFVLMAVFLGSFGAHNFYAGYNKKAAVQLCVTLFTCFWASWIMWIWAIVEACTVTLDDDGVPLN